MKKSAFLYLVVFSTLFSCNSAINEAKLRKGYDIASSADQETDPEDKENDLENEELLPICTRFYNEVCLSEMASPDAVLNESGYYVLDLKSYKSELAKTKIFTDRFVAMQDDVFAECRRALESEKITAEDTEEGIEMNAPAPCGFMHYAYYFHAQEEPDNFRLKQSSIKANSASTEIHFYTGDRNWDDLVYLKVELKKLNGSWRIDKVEKKL